MFHVVLLMVLGANVPSQSVPPPPGLYERPDVSTLRALRAVTVARTVGIPVSPGDHVHHCNRCGTEWSHAMNAGHNCPECGNRVTLVARSGPTRVNRVIRETVYVPVEVQRPAQAVAAPVVVSRIPRPMPQAPPQTVAAPPTVVMMSAPVATSVQPLIRVYSGSSYSSGGGGCANGSCGAAPQRSALGIFRGRRY